MHVCVCVCGWVCVRACVRVCVGCMPQNAMECLVIKSILINVAQFALCLVCMHVSVILLMHLYLNGSAIPRLLTKSPCVL